ncbi:MAG TPA: PAS domain S-box protein [Syntrophales bacterium]|nr:PAS domain S-box protein [Syntrophales bacterium]
MQDRRKTKAQLIDELNVLRDRDALCQRLLSSVGDAVLVLDGFRIEDCNPRAQALFGRTREQLIGRTPLAVSPEKQPNGTPSARLGPELLAAVQPGEPLRCEWQYLGPNGTPVSTELVLQRLNGGSRVLVVSHDLTERKSVDDLYRALARNSPIGVFLAVGGKFVYTNRKFCELTGYDRKELSGRPSGALVHPEDRDWARRNALLMLQGVVTEPFEFRAVKKDGAISWTMETVSSITFRGRRAVLGNCMDVTRQKLTEAALRESEARYRTIIADIVDGYYEVDLTGRFTFFNDRVWQMLGYPREETMGLSYLQYTPEAAARKVFEVFNRVYRTGEPYHGLEWEIMRKDGTLGFGEASVSLIRDADGNPSGFRGIVRETTERRKMEEIIRNLAYEDDLTGLPNRRAFLERFTREIARAGRHGRKFMIAMMDLDRFKEVNDTLGHPMGDRLLKAVAQRIRGLLRKEDTVARLGGDEFALLIPDISDRTAGERVGDKLVAAFRSAFRVDPHVLEITTSIGMAVYPDDGLDEEVLGRNADSALYRAKEKGRNGWAWREGHSADQFRQGDLPFLNRSKGRESS